jgi:hypothetical protein
MNSPLTPPLSPSDGERVTTYGFIGSMQKYELALFPVDGE